MVGGPAVTGAGRAVPARPSGALSSAHFRVDASDSNALTVWRALGAPLDPTDEQLAAIKKRQGLEELEPVADISVSGDWSTSLDLPPPSVSLLVLEPS